MTNYYYGINCHRTGFVPKSKRGLRISSLPFAVHGSHAQILSGQKSLITLRSLLSIISPSFYFPFFNFYSRRTLYTPPSQFHTPTLTCAPPHSLRQIHHRRRTGAFQFARTDFLD